MKKYLKETRKKSFIGIMLAIVLMFSFNFSPLCVFAEKFSNRLAGAYSSSATKNFYGPNLVTTESGVSTAEKPKGWDEYFSDSNVNYNINSKYNELFDTWFKKYADSYLVEQDSKSSGYGGLYARYLKKVGYASLSEYYEARKSNELSSYPDFRTYFEAFVSMETKWTETVDGEDEEFVLKALFDIEDLIASFFQSQIYNSFANYIETEQRGTYVQEAITGTDGLTPGCNFYNDSISYKRVKKAIDSQIAKTSPTVGFDGMTQDDYSASIKADNAPVKKDFYYSDKDYESVTKPNVDYVKNSTTKIVNVYSFETATDLADESSYKDFIVKNKMTFLELSELTASPLYYRLIQEGEFGYISKDHPTFYKYSKVPYEVLNSIYQVYIVDDYVTDSERATYDSLYYATVISSDDITNDKNLITNDGTNISTKDCYYVPIPYFFDNTAIEMLYFQKIFGITKQNEGSSDFSRLLNLLINTADKTCRAYFKISSTTTNKVVYAENLSNFNTATLGTGYSYEVRQLEIGGDDNLTMEDYSQITSSDSGYYTEKYPNLYFKRTRTYYEKTSTTYGDYYTSPTPVVSYEKTKVAGSSLATDKIYALVSETTIGDKTYKTVSTDAVNGLTDLYVKVDPALAPDTVNTFYYKHTVDADGNVETSYETENGSYVFYVLNDQVTVKGVSYTALSDSSFAVIKDLYVEVSSKTSTELNEENGTVKFYYKHNIVEKEQLYVVAKDSTTLNKDVYKNLGYKFITTDEFKETFYNYIAVDSTDENFNKNFALYYKVVSNSQTKQDYQANSDLFVQNLITGKNAVYIVDDSLSSTDKGTYRGLYYNTITTKEFKNNSSFYVQISEDDENYSSIYTKLYYKYASSSEVKKDIYLYSSSSSSIYKTFTSSESGYDAKAYEKIEYGDPNYVQGLDLYYKKHIESTSTERETMYGYYYYKTSSALELKANSYYAISFYLYTNGNYYDENDNLVTDNDIQASFYIKDSKKAISDISIENLSTNGEWKQYTAFIATNALNASNITMYFRLGNEETIAGNTENERVNGFIVFDNILVTLIGETDYATKSIDGVNVSGEVIEHDEKEVEFPIVTREEVDEIEGRYELITDLQVAEDMLLDATEYSYYYKFKLNADNTVSSEYELDENSKKVIYAFVETNDQTNTTRKINVITATRTYNNVDKYKNESIVVDETMLDSNQVLDNKLRNDDIFADWNTTFDFDNYVSDENHADLGNLPFDGTEDGFNANLSDWKYYISRSDSGQGNNETLKALRNAYLNGKLDVSIIEESTIDKTIKKSDDDKKDESKDDDSKKDDKDVPYISSTFKSDNKVLMLDNKDKVRSLGIASKTFTIKQNEYYKITVWVYTPDEDATVTVKLESILKTSSTENNGSLLTSTASKISPYLSGYKTTPLNEYSWIPISFYVEGNNYHNQDVYLALLADAKSKVYFDNITVERSTSTAFDTANSDSDTLTYCLTLSPSSSSISSGITNGYFDLSTLTTEKVDYSTPRSVESWKVSDGNSSGAVAGVVQTSEDYIKNANNGKNTFFTKYNNGKYLSTSGFANNVFAIYSPERVKSTISGASDDEYLTRTNYKIYSSSISVSAGKIYEISVEFASGVNFNGDMSIALYFSSVSASNLISEFKVHEENTTGNNSKWTKYTFYVLGGTSTTTLYLEIGVENAIGTAFFQKASSVTSTETSLEAIRDKIINDDENTSAGTGSIYDFPSLSKVRFADLNDSSFSMRASESDKYDNVYPNTNYTNSDIPSTTYTVGETGTVVASYFTKSESTYYTVKIENYKFIRDNGTDDSHNYVAEVDDDKTYYIKPITDEISGIVSYKLYSDSMFTIEVVGFDINSKGKIEDSEINNYEIKLVGETVKITINKKETAATEVVKTNYKYNFSEDVSMGNTYIPASELNNNYSENVLIISNSQKTDYTVVSPSLKGSLSSKSFYVLKVYAKVGNINPYKADSKAGLNISIDSVTVNWNNIQTNSSQNVDENGFVCYELWITTNASSFSELKVKFSLGSKEETCSGYAIIADISLEKFASETLFNEYVNAKEDLYKEDDANSIVKRYFGKADSSSNSDSNKDSSSSSIWATFFYIFSSLLLGIVLIMAFVATIIKKHPIKKRAKVGKDDDIIVVSPTNNVKPELNKKNKKTGKEAEADSIEVLDEKADESENVETSENQQDETTETTETAKVTETTETFENNNSQDDNEIVATSKKKDDKKVDNDNEEEGF